MSFTVLYLRNTNYIISDSSVELPASRVTGTMVHAILIVIVVVCFKMYM